MLLSQSPVPLINMIVLWQITHAYNMINEQYIKFNIHIGFHIGFRGFHRLGGLQCWYNHHPQPPVGDQDVTNVMDVDSCGDSVLMPQYLFVGVLLTLLPLWKKLKDNKCTVFYGPSGGKMRELYTFQVRENVAWGLSGHCGFWVFCAWSCGAKGTSNKHVTIDHSPQRLTT